MKKLFLMAIVAICMALPTKAQEKGDMAAGVHFALGTGDSFTNYGIGAKFQWNMIDKLRMEPSFTYFLKKDYISMWDISANVHYQFVVADRLNLYPLAGVSITGVKASYDLEPYYGSASASDAEFEFNIGGGMDFSLSEKLNLNVEAKYKIGGNWNWFIASVGLGYKFLDINI